MSTTVTYKGNTLTTAENQTRVLKTAGKYMEDDVTITDVTSGGGASLTTVTFGTYSSPSVDLVVFYTDANGQAVAATTAPFQVGQSYNLPSGSLIVVLDKTDFGMSGIWNSALITGVTHITDGSKVLMSRTSVYWRVLQVD